MNRLPEKIRRTLEKLVAELKTKENVYGIGLFGSWARGDATSSSDIDLLILERGNFNCEYVDRIALNGLFIDLNHIPKNWIRTAIPPEIDQKLYEMQIFYDRDWSLTSTKLLMAKLYGSPERVEIRTDGHIIESDIYLSRATSAFSRRDFYSAYVFAVVALENILKVLIEIALEPFSNSQFLEKLKTSSSKLGMANLFSEFLNITTLDKADNMHVKEKTKLFKLIWEDLSLTVKQNFDILESSHFKVKTKLGYYLNPNFLQGLLLRVNALVELEKFAEASHYLNRVLLDMLENYVWFKSAVKRVKVDNTTMLHSLEILEGKNSKNLNNILLFLNLTNLKENMVADVIEKVKRTTSLVRGERKVLIGKRLSSS
ncbi:MAG: nucleotidyltransferase domain-containing protein [Candidatus Bathyarchaeia archaeon]